MNQSHDVLCSGWASPARLGQTGHLRIYKGHCILAVFCTVSTVNEALCDEPPTRACRAVLYENLAEENLRYKSFRSCSPDWVCSSRIPFRALLGRGAFLTPAKIFHLRLSNDWLQDNLDI